MKCNDCNTALEPSEAICVSSAVAPDKCDVHPKCEEVYCEECWEND